MFDCTARGDTYPDCIIATCEYDFQEGQGAIAPERFPSERCRDIESISAITLATHNMSRAVCFYRMLGFEYRSWW